MAEEQSGWRPLELRSRRAAAADGTGRPVDLGASPFSRLALTHVISASGDALVTLALAGSLFFNISPTAARSRVALSLLFTMAPFAIVAPFLGPIIDRTRGGRRMMVFVSAVGRALACLAMARVVKGLMLFPAAFTSLVFSKGYQVAKASLVPTVVKSHDELVQANSRLAVGAAVVGFAVTLPGLAVYKLLGAPALLNMAAVVFLAMAVASLRIVSRLPAEDGVEPDAAPGGTLAGPLPAGQAPSGRTMSSRAVVGPAVAMGALAMGALRAMSGFATFLIAFSFRRGHVATWWFGIVIVFSVVGGLLGAATAPRMRSRIKEEHMVVGALAAVAVLGLAMAEIGGTFAAAILAGGVAFASTGGKQAFDSMVQRDVPRESQARAFARFEASFQFVWVVGALVPVVLPIGERLGFVLIACGALVTGVVHLISRWQDRAAPVRWPAGDDSDDGPPAASPFPPPPLPPGPFPVVVPPPLSGPHAPPSPAPPAP